MSAPAWTADLSQSIARLDASAKHWTLKTENSDGGRRYSCKVWAHGKRFSVNRKTALSAVVAAIEQMEGRGQKGLRLVG